MIALASAPWGVSAKSHPFWPTTKGRMAFSTWLLVAAVSIRNQDAAEALKGNSSPIFRFGFSDIRAAQLNVRAFWWMNRPMRDSEVSGLHALTTLLSLMNQLSPLDDSRGSFCFRYCHVLLSIVFQVYLFSGFSFSSTMDKYRTISVVCQCAGLLSGYGTSQTTSSFSDTAFCI